MKTFKLLQALALLLTPLTLPALAQRPMEYLTRGLVAIHQGGGKVFLSWRLLATDPDDITFNLYRSTPGSQPTKLNPQPLRTSTDFVDTGVKLDAPTNYAPPPLTA
jgi:rhamnogalacturonan endolyase